MNTCIECDSVCWLVSYMYRMWFNERIDLLAYYVHVHRVWFSELIGRFACLVHVVYIECGFVSWLAHLVIMYIFTDCGSVSWLFYMFTMYTYVECDSVICDCMHALATAILCACTTSMVRVLWANAINSLATTFEHSEPKHKISTTSLSKGMQPNVVFYKGVF